MPPVRSTSVCPARAAIAGNPSDMYGGAVVAVPVRAVAATVTLTSSDVFRVPGVDASPTSLGELDEHVVTSGPGHVQPLVAATLVALWRRFRADVSPVAVDVSTDIPRGVGLAGSSAIVVATIRALAARHDDRPWARSLRGDPWLLATTALDAEASVLGIIAGMQDRVVQAVGHNVFMDLSERRPEGHGTDTERYRVLGPLPGVAFVAIRSGHSSDSGAVHAGADARSPSFAPAMRRLARTAHAAAVAIDAVDHRALAAAMNETFDLRASCMQLDPAHVEMVEIARAQGAAATYTGSGGAITVLCEDHDGAVRASDALRDGLGCEILWLD